MVCPWGLPDEDCCLWFLGENEDMMFRTLLAILRTIMSRKAKKAKSKPNKHPKGPVINIIFYALHQGFVCLNMILKAKNICQHHKYQSIYIL